MRKWLMIALGSVTSLVWIAVIVMIFTSAEDVNRVYNHSGAYVSSLPEKSIAGFETRLRADGVKSTKKQHVKTILGQQKLTKLWIEDVSDDGKVSIDTLIQSLDLNVIIHSNQ